MSNPDLPPDSITTLPPEARLYAIRRRYDAMAYSGPTTADRERDTVIGHLLDLIDQRTQQITDPDFPDLVGVVGGPLIPCKVTEFTATMALTERVEGVGGLDAHYGQTQRYVIRYQPKPVEITYMTGVSGEEIERAKQAVIGTVVEMVSEMHARFACPGWQYATTEGPRKQWADADTPPEGEGWERNTDAGRDGWERFDYSERSYWRRPIPERERRVHENPALAEQIREGIAEAERGETVDLGSFAQHLDQRDDDD